MVGSCDLGCGGRVGKDSAMRYVIGHVFGGGAWGAWLRRGPSKKDRFYNQIHDDVTENKC